MAVQVEAPTLVPPLRVSVMLDWPLVTSEVRIFSMDVAVRAQFWKAPLKAPGASVPVVLNMFAGNVARLVQPFHPFKKTVPTLKARAGKEVSAMQPSQALLKLVPLMVLIKGKDVSFLQSYHAAVKFVPLPVLINGNEVSSRQEFHAS